MKELEVQRRERQQHEGQATDERKAQGSGSTYYNVYSNKVCGGRRDRISSTSINEKKGGEKTEEICILEMT